MDGYVFLERCRENPKTTWIPILVLTAYTQAEAEIDVLDSGANDFMTKPISRLELMARIRSLLRTHSRVEQLQAQVKKRDEIIRSLAKTLEEHIGKEKTKSIVEELGLKQPSHP
jgi:DNA-binding response OmpR family regulator